MISVIQKIFIIYLITQTAFAYKDPNTYTENISAYAGMVNQQRNNIFDYKKLSITNDNAYCQSKNAQCGKLYKADTEEVVQCSPCSSGESCVSNRCEPICHSEQFGTPNDSLLIHMPLTVNDDDLSNLDNHIDVIKRMGVGFTSNIDFSKKQIKVKLAKPYKKFSLSSFSFRLLPEKNRRYTEIINTNRFKVYEKNNTLTIQARGVKRKRYSLAIEGELKTSSCNSIIINFYDNRFDVFINGKKFTKNITDGGRLNGKVKRLRAGVYSGKIWDLRYYSRVLQDDEVATLASDCKNGPSANPYKDGYPNFICGAYVCLWWPLDSDLEEGEQPIPLAQYEYYLKKQDEVYERNVIGAGMYLHGDICGFFQWAKEAENGNGGRNLILSYGIRKTFVKKHSEEKPVNQYWLHENFHSFQGKLKSYSKGQKRGNKFLLESTASWGPDAIIPGEPEAKDSLLGMYTLMPHLPLWSDQSSPIDEKICSRFKGGHQYGAFIFFSYISRYILDNRFIGDIYNDDRAKSKPIAVVNDLLLKAGHNLKQIFADFAAKTVNYDYLYKDSYITSEEASCRRMYSKDDDYIPETCIEDSPKIAMYLDDQGTFGKWVNPPSEYQIGSWAYNTFQISPSDQSTYQVGVALDENNPIYSELQARVIINNLNDNSYQYLSIESIKPGEEKSLKIQSPENAVVYLVVVSTPNKFNAFESYQYKYMVQKIAE